VVRRAVHYCGCRDGSHLRLVHYKILSQKPRPIDWFGKGDKYANTDKHWNNLAVISKTARYLELVPLDDFVDRRAPESYDKLVRDPAAPSVERNEYDGLNDMHLPAELDLPSLELLADRPAQPYITLNFGPKNPAEASTKGNVK
jgi:hypothetical protein